MRGPSRFFRPRRPAKPGTALHADGRAHGFARQPSTGGSDRGPRTDKPRRWPGNDVRAQICAMCGSSPSVAEIAARLSLPVGVARVLIGDLVAAGHLRVRTTLSERSTVDERRELIGRTLRGLRAL